MVRKIEKPPLSEKEQIEETALTLQTWIAVGFGKRKTNELGIRELLETLNQAVIEWRESNLLLILSPEEKADHDKDKVELSAQALQAAWTSGFEKRRTDDHRIQDLNNYVLKILKQWKESETKKLENASNNT